MDVTDVKYRVSGKSSTKSKIQIVFLMAKIECPTKAIRKIQRQGSSEVPERHTIIIPRPSHCYISGQKSENGYKKKQRSAI
jgi:hypothetical protein